MQKDKIEMFGLIDQRNKDWFDAVSAAYSVAFGTSTTGEYSVYTIGDEMVFYLPTGEVCVDSFSHELLHGYMDANGFHLGGNLKNTLWQSNILKKIFDNDLSEHLSNCISHFLMLPLFLERGFGRGKFLRDYHTYKLEPGLMNELQRYYKQAGQYSLPAVKTFIGKFFAFKCDPNPDFDYSRPLEQLRKIDSQLYLILNKYFESWHGYNFSNDPWSEYRNINAQLYSDFKPWLAGKRIG